MWGVWRTAVALVVLFAPGGTTATASIAAYGAVGAVAVSPATGRVLVGINDRDAGTGLWWSDDQGRHWHLARGLGKISGVSALAFSHSQPNIAYAGVFWSDGGLRTGVLASSDGGASWHAVSWNQRIRSLPASIDALVIDPSRPDTVYATTHGVIRRTLDGGRTWTLARTGLPFGPEPFPPDRRLVADAGGALYFATGRARGPGQIYRSRTRGASWQPAGHGLPAALPWTRVIQLASDVAREPGTVYAASARGVYRTRDAGRTWAPIYRSRSLTVGTTNGSVFILAVQPTGPARLLRRSNTEPWTLLPAPPFLDAFALDPNGRRLYGWSYDVDDSKERYCARLFGSSDGGASWAEIGRALPLDRENCGSA